MVKEANRIDELRYERKFQIYQLGECGIEAIVRGHPAMFVEAFPPRYVNNIYMDSSTMKSYFDNVHGVKERKKVRIRWYGELFGLIHGPVLERKFKNGLLGWKEIYELHSFRLDNKFTWRILHDLFSEAGMPRSLLLVLSSLNPVLLNRYKRKYFVSSDSRFRITIDFRRVFYKIGRFNNMFCGMRRDDGSVIVELKYNREYDEQAKYVSSIFPFRMTKSSKYVSGIECLSM